MTVKKKKTNQQSQKDSPSLLSSDEVWSAEGVAVDALEDLEDEPQELNLAAQINRLRAEIRASKLDSIGRMAPNHHAKLKEKEALLRRSIASYNAQMDTSPVDRSQANILVSKTACAEEVCSSFIHKGLLTCTSIGHLQVQAMQEKVLSLGELLGSPYKEDQDFIKPFSMPSRSTAYVLERVQAALVSMAPALLTKFFESKVLEEAIKQGLDPENVRVTLV